MTNAAIADNFSLLSKLMDIHEENSFRAKSYSIATFHIEKLPEELSVLPKEKIFTIKGIGESAGQKIVEQLETGTLKVLEDYINKTPKGIIEMLQYIKGLGPKKIATVWKEMGIESIGELLYACNENRLTLYKGFGEKTQESVRKSIEFYLNTFGSYLYAQVETYALTFETHLKQFFKTDLTDLVGDFKRQIPVIEKIEFTTSVSQQNIKNFFTTNGYQIQDENEYSISLKGNENILLQFYFTTKENYYTTVFKHNCSEQFLNKWTELFGFDAAKNYTSEQEIFATHNVQFIDACKRESVEVIELAKQHQLPVSITEKDITAIIHSHSKWSDGSNTLEEMVKAAIAKGLQYLVISDHSKTAFYAQGLTVERVLAQHQEIDELNKKYAPFKIFKSIESDILGDGSLDYETDILQQFDLVIASIHSNLNVTEEKAMQRLITAIENPYTTILGHLTGRLLLSRNGYPINHHKIIDACAAHNVVIELNAHPRRLDIDWQFIDAALEKNVIISINPDAHNIDGYDDCRYGVLAAQKTLLTKEKNLSSFSLQQFEEFLSEQGKKK
ncbi:MAG: PHP domain-containing protein [Bacteroidetes bacterium]|nr:PHP domain-containing protein [Bacteroidota bacterium]